VVEYRLVHEPDAPWIPLSTNNQVNVYTFPFQYVNPSFIEAPSGVANAARDSLIGGPVVKVPTSAESRIVIREYDGFAASPDTLQSSEVFPVFTASTLGVTDWSSPTALVAGRLVGLMIVPLSGGSAESVTVVEGLDYTDVHL
jgi:hypothetical protein